MMSRVRMWVILAVFGGAGVMLTGLGTLLAWPAVREAWRGRTAPAVVTAMIKCSPEHTDIITELSRAVKVTYADGTIVSAVWRTGVVEGCAGARGAVPALLREMLTADAAGCERAARRVCSANAAPQARLIECVETACVLTPLGTTTNSCTVITTLRTDAQGSNTMWRQVQGAPERVGVKEFMLKERSHTVEFRPVMTFTAAGREISAAADVARRGAPPAGYGMYERARVIYTPAGAQIFVMPDFSSARQASVLAAVTRVIEAAGVVWLAPLMLIVLGIAVLLGCAVFVSLDIWPGRRQMSGACL